MSNRRFLAAVAFFYERRRVPARLAHLLVETSCRLSPHTASPKEAKKRCTLRDLEWDARFEAADAANRADEELCLGSGPIEPGSSLAQQESARPLPVETKRHWCVWHPSFGDIEGVYWPLGVRTPAQASRTWL